MCFVQTLYTLLNLLFFSSFFSFFYIRTLTSDNVWTCIHVGYKTIRVNDATCWMSCGKCTAYMCAYIGRASVEHIPYGGWCLRYAICSWYARNVQNVCMSLYIQLSFKKNCLRMKCMASPMNTNRMPINWKSSPKNNLKSNNNKLRPTS